MTDRLGDKEVCLAFATHDDEKKYNSYMIEIVDPEKVSSPQRFQWNEQHLT